MTQTTRPRRHRFLHLVAACMLSLAWACSDEPEPESAESAESAGDESTLQRTKRRVDEAHEEFKEDVRPASSEVDRVAHEAVDEGKKAAHKTADAVTGEDDEEEQEAEE